MSVTRKRARPPETQPGLSSQSTKKRKTSGNLSESKSLEAYWNTLSQVHLDRSALEELNRRNAGRLPLSGGSSPGQIHRQARTSIIKPAEFLRRCSLRQLKGLQRFARHGGPDLSSLKSHPELVERFDPAMSSSSTSRRSASNSTVNRTTDTSTKPPTARTKSTGPYSRNFEQKLIDEGIHFNGYEFPDGREQPEPANMGEIKERLRRPRPSLSPSRFGKEEFRSFVRADANAKKEEQVRDSVIPIIAGRRRIGNTVSGGIPFGALQPLVEVEDGGEKLAMPKPDIYHGARPEQLHRQVREELGPYICPSTQEDLPIAPNYFLAAKGPDGTGAVVRRQAGYDGAIGARAMHRLQSYGQDELEYDGNAYSFSSTYNDGYLKINPHHPGLSQDSKTETYMNFAKGYGMTSDLETCRAGAAAYRNAADLAAEYRNQFIAQANARLASRQSTSTATSSGLSFPASTVRLESTESETSAEEHVDEARPPSKRSSRSSASHRFHQKRPATTEQPRKDVRSRSGWVHEDGVYRCKVGEIILAEQEDSPKNVWIYRASGWPKQGVGKKYVYRSSDGRLQFK